MLENILHGWLERSRELPYVLLSGDVEAWRLALILFIVGSALLVTASCLRALVREHRLIVRTRSLPPSPPVDLESMIAQYYPTSLRAREHRATVVNLDARRREMHLVAMHDPRRI